MTLLFQYLFFFIVLSLGMSLNVAGHSPLLEAGQEALRTVWGVVAMLVYLAVWALCGLAAGFITSRKRQGFALGCIGGVFLGPLALLIALLVPRKRRVWF